MMWFWNWFTALAAFLNCCTAVHHLQDPAEVTVPQVMQHATLQRSRRGRGVHFFYPVAKNSFVHKS
jgi:hypothetical protein